MKLSINCRHYDRNARPPEPSDGRIRLQSRSPAWRFVCTRAPRIEQASSPESRFDIWTERESGVSDRSRMSSLLLLIDTGRKAVTLSRCSCLSPLWTMAPWMTNLNKQKRL